MLRAPCPSASDALRRDRERQKGRVPRHVVGTSNPIARMTAITQDDAAVPTRVVGTEAQAPIYGIVATIARACVSDCRCPSQRCQRPVARFIRRVTALDCALINTGVMRQLYATQH